MKFVSNLSAVMACICMVAAMFAAIFSVFANGFDFVVLMVLLLAVSAAFAIIAYKCDHK